MNKKKVKNQVIGQLFGVDVSDYQVVQLTKNSFEGINLLSYPADKAHMLVYALQFRLPPPSLQTMKKTERRNKAKIAKVAGDVIKAPFRKMAMAIFGDNLKRGAKRVTSTVTSKLAKAIRNIKPSVARKWKVCSPEQIVLKSARRICLDMLESTWRKQLMVGKSFKKVKPSYFIKKKANQKRRRQERFELIKKNKQKLVKIFGNKIFGKQLRISRAQIKKALGIEQSQLGLNRLREFNQMVEKRGVIDVPVSIPCRHGRSMSSKFNKPKVQSKQGYSRCATLSPSISHLTSQQKWNQNVKHKQYPRLKASFWEQINIYSTSTKSNNVLSNHKEFPTILEAYSDNKQHHKKR